MQVWAALRAYQSMRARDLLLPEPPKVREGYTTITYYYYYYYHRAMLSSLLSWTYLVQGPDAFPGPHSSSSCSARMAPQVEGSSQAPVMPSPPRAHNLGDVLLLLLRGQEFPALSLHPGYLQAGQRVELCGPGLTGAGVGPHGGFTPTSRPTREGLLQPGRWVGIIGGRGGRKALTRSSSSLTPQPPPFWGSHFFQLAYVPSPSTDPTLPIYCAMAVVAAYLLSLTSHIYLNLYTYAYYLRSSPSKARKVFFHSLVGSFVYGHGDCRGLSGPTKVAALVVGDGLVLWVMVRLLDAVACDYGQGAVPVLVMNPAIQVGREPTNRD